MAVFDTNADSHTTDSAKGVCVLQIGAGGVGGVVAHKMAMNRAVFSRIILASRTLSKCRAIADSIRAKGLGEIEIDTVDADNIESLVALITKYRPKLVINVALPYQDLTIMEACLRTKTHYLDTANYEHPDVPHFEYKEQWAYDSRYKEAGIFALLGSGFDPGVTNVFCAYAAKHYFDEIHSIDILDCNAGDHGYAFATNFNPEINLREVSSRGRYWVKNASLGKHFIDLENFESSQATSLASPPKFSKNSQSLTANTSICDENAESKPVQAAGFFSENTQNLKAEKGRSISEEKSLLYEARQGSYLDGCGSEATSVANATDHFVKSLRANDRSQDEIIKDLYPKDKPTESTQKPTQPHTLVSPLDLAFNPDLTEDKIYRKFEREEKHWQEHSASGNHSQDSGFSNCSLTQDTRIADSQNTESQAGSAGLESKNIESQQGRSIFDEKSGLCRSECGDKTDVSVAQTSDKLHDFSRKDKPNVQCDKTHYCNGEWRDIAPLALMKAWHYPEVGEKNSYLLYHEELESLVRNIKGLRKIRFFMTFGESYLTHMKCLENVGLLRVDSITHKGQKIVPIEVLKTLLPDPASLAARTKGQTHIGCYMRGVKDGKERTIYIYNICEHEKCYAEVNAQGVSYTTGVPAMIGAKLICEGKWGLGVPKLGQDSVFGSFCGSSEKSLQSFTSSKIPCDFSHNPRNLRKSLESLNVANEDSTQDARIAESCDVDSQNTESTERNDHDLSTKDKPATHSNQDFIANRLALNADMPKGGEYQGIDNATELCGGDNMKLVEAVEMKNRSFQDGGEGSLVSLETKADNAESAIFRSNATQGAGVWNMEQNDPDPFMQELNIQGLPYVVLEIESNGEKKVLEDGRKRA